MEYTTSKTHGITCPHKNCGQHTTLIHFRNFVIYYENYSSKGLQADM